MSIVSFWSSFTSTVLEFMCFIVKIEVQVANLGTLNSNTVNSKFHLIQGLGQLFATVFLISHISCLECVVNCNIVLEFFTNASQYENANIANFVLVV